MGNLKCVLALFVLVGATHINGDETMPANASSAPLNILFPPLLIPITPIDVIIEPRFVTIQHVIHGHVPGAPIGNVPGASPPRADKKGQLLTPADGCGFSALGNHRIVGGGPARNGAWPWMALLAYKAPPQLAHLIATFNCGGSLITTRHVLSAAHCVSPELWFARLGEHDVRTEADGQHEDILITSKRVHPQYNKDLLIYDVSVLTLQRDVTFNDRIRPICLPIDPPNNSKSFVGQNPFSTGWGITSEGGQQSPFLKQVQVPVVDTNVCREIFRRTGVLRSELQISNMIVCAGIHAGQASCQGDSGGPLQLPVHENGKFPYYQIGIVSWGIPCAKPNIPTVYSSTQFFGKWIKSQLY